MGGKIVKEKLGRFRENILSDFQLSLPENQLVEQN